MTAKVILPARVASDWSWWITPLAILVLVLLALVIAFIVLVCVRPGPEGERGPRGLQGNTGSTGMTGPEGLSIIGPTGEQVRFVYCILFPHMYHTQGDTGSAGNTGATGFITVSCHFVHVFISCRLVLYRPYRQFVYRADRNSLERNGYVYVVT